MREKGDSKDLVLDFMLYVLDICNTMIRDIVI